MAAFCRETLAQRTRRLCGIEEPRELSIWPKYRLQRQEEFEKSKKKECLDGGEEKQKIVLIG